MAHLGAKSLKAPIWQLRSFNFFSFGGFSAALPGNQLGLFHRDHHSLAECLWNVFIAHTIVISACV